MADGSELWTDGFASRLSRRRLLGRASLVGAGVPAAALLGGGLLRTRSTQAAQTPGCPSPPATPVVEGSPESPSGLKIGVTVAYLSVPFYANFKTGLEDGANRFGFEYELRDGQGDLAVELANIQDFIAQGVACILLTPSGEGIIPAIKLANDAGIPVIEVNNKAGFGSDEVQVVTYVGADDVEFGRLQGQLLHDTFGDVPVKIGYVQGIAGTSPQILRGQGFEEVIAQYPDYEIIARVSNDFDNAKSLAVTQDLLTRFPKGELDVIVMQGPEGAAPSKFAHDNGREEVKFIVGDYPADIRQAIIDGDIVGTINQDPYPQAFEGMHMAWLLLNGRESEIPKPNFLTLPIVTQENVEQIPPAWGC